jgi:hypothetical protein
VPSISENETEVSFFNREMYESFKLNPQVFSIPATLHSSFILLNVDSMGKLKSFLHSGRDLE